MPGCSRRKKATGSRISARSTRSATRSRRDIHGGPGATTRRRRQGAAMADREWPDCMRCKEGQLIPLSDYGRDGAPITYKAWVCTNPACGFNVRIDNGEISLGRAIGQSTKE